MKSLFAVAIALLVMPSLTLAAKPVRPDYPALEQRITDLEAAVQSLQENSQNMEQCFDRYDYFGNQSVIMESITPSLIYTAENSSAILSIEMWDDLKAGTYLITSDSYAHCSKCVLIQETEKFFLADSGTLTVAVSDGTNFAGTLNGAHLVEVVIDLDWDSTPVPNGETRCLDNYHFNAVNKP